MTNTVLLRKKRKNKVHARNLTIEFEVVTNELINETIRCYGPLDYDVCIKVLGFFNNYNILSTRKHLKH